MQPSDQLITAIVGYLRKVKPDLTIVGMGTAWWREESSRAAVSIAGLGWRVGPIRASPAGQHVRKTASIRRMSARAQRPQGDRAQATGWQRVIAKTVNVSIEAFFRVFWPPVLDARFATNHAHDSTSQKFRRFPTQRVLPAKRKARGQAAAVVTSTPTSAGGEAQAPACAA
jgi:hypothetical protein